MIGIISYGQMFPAQAPADGRGLSRLPAQTPSIEVGGSGYNDWLNLSPKCLLA